MSDSLHIFLISFSYSTDFTLLYFALFYLDLHMLNMLGIYYNLSKSILYLVKLIIRHHIILPWINSCRKHLLKLQCTPKWVVTSPIKYLSIINIRNLIVAWETLNWIGRIISELKNKNPQKNRPRSHSILVTRIKILCKCLNLQLVIIKLTLNRSKRILEFTISIDQSHTLTGKSFIARNQNLLFMITQTLHYVSIESLALNN